MSTKTYIDEHGDMVEADVLPDGEIELTVQEASAVNSQLDFAGALESKSLEVRSYIEARYSDTDQKNLIASAGEIGLKLILEQRPPTNEELVVIQQAATCKAWIQAVREDFALNGANIDLSKFD